MKVKAVKTEIRKKYILLIIPLFEALLNLVYAKVLHKTVG